MLAQKLFKQAKALSPGGISDPDGLDVQVDNQRMVLTYFVLGDKIQFLIKPKATRYARHVLEVTKKGATAVPLDEVPKNDLTYREQSVVLSDDALMEIYLKAIEQALESAS